MERLRNSWDVLSHVTCCNVLTLVVEPPLSNSTKNSEYKTSKHGIVQRWQYWISVSTQGRIYLSQVQNWSTAGKLYGGHFNRTCTSGKVVSCFFPYSSLDFLSKQDSFPYCFPRWLLWHVTDPTLPLSTLKKLSFDLHHHYVTPTLSNCCVRCPCGLKITPIPDQTLTFL